MKRPYLLINFLLITTICFPYLTVLGQQVKNVPKAFKSLSPNPEIIILKNNLKTPTEGGHLQGVQLIEKNGVRKLLISGSSATKAYILQVDLASRTTDKLFSLMNNPYRHAGGIQVSGNYLIVGIEDDQLKTTSKVCFYNFLDNNLDKADPNFTMYRKGEAKQQTAGAAGLLALDNDYLAVVRNWDSRNWDFYQIAPDKGEQKLYMSFEAPKDWASYQSINLIKDTEAIYAIGFYGDQQFGYADLILVSQLGTFQPIMKKVMSSTFNCKKGVDFNTAVGLQVDKKGRLYIWATQRNATKEFFINRFIQD